ncbi:sensor histidine kinase [Streptococcus cuniculi]|uniref:histidine kinase n=1 Tax=Streptococcus cuniculi TaxID=1432788 RepID=A0A4Y9JC16_9STRE|nr:sensor histidine kinase [Streptococcus cuniculi]MBF0778116.1 sensor histidine kinase [Streptococcus cuniculi]TFU98121.1 HAMP domain-containing histidine kinase [Streptococcus cuniculi]
MITKRQVGFFIRQWLLTRWIFLVGVLGFLGLIGGMSALFRVEMALVAYTSLLLMGIGIVVFAVDVIKEWTKYRRVERKEGLVSGTAAELILQERIGELEETLKARRDQDRAQQSEFQDYYTLWAHQMKIPIAASQLLVGDLPTSKEKQALERELFKIEQYTGLVLNYLRLQSFHEDLVVERQSLDVLVRQVVKKFSIFFIQQKTELRLEELNLMIATDKKWLSLLLEQFISNAIKYTAGGQIWIYLDGDELVIQDTGIGISKSDMERIFARGFSGYNGRISQQSSGLGLYLAQGISEKLGMTFSLTSEVGTGTQVRISLEEERLVID